MLRGGYQSSQGRPGLQLYDPDIFQLLPVDSPQEPLGGSPAHFDPDKIMIRIPGGLLRQKAAVAESDLDVDLAIPAEYLLPVQGPLHGGPVDEGPDRPVVRPGAGVDGSWG